MKQSTEKPPMITIHFPDQSASDHQEWIVDIVTNFPWEEEKVLSQVVVTAIEPPISKESVFAAAALACAEACDRMDLLRSVEAVAE